MKRIISISLVVLLLLNVMGFYGVFLGLNYSNSQQLRKQFDANQLSELPTVTLKVPISVPYYSNTDFERVDGEIEHKGEVYRLVKQRYANDTLYIVCIKDEKSKDIKQALNDYVKTFTDHPTQHQSQGKTIPSFIKEYLIEEIKMDNASSGWSYGLTTSSEEAPLIAVSLSVASPPPEV